MLQEVPPVCGNLGRKTTLGALVLFTRLRCIAVDAKSGRVIASSSREASPTTHPLHFQSGHDDDDDDDDDPDDIHHYASPASPAVIMTIITTHPLHFQSGIIQDKKSVTTMLTMHPQHRRLS